MEGKGTMKVAEKDPLTHIDLELMDNMKRVFDEAKKEGFKGTFKDFLDTLSEEDLKTLFPPLLHSVCLVYSNSEHYNSPARIIILMQEVCNLLISLAKKHIEPSTVFQIEVEEALTKCQDKVKLWNCKFTTSTPKERPISGI